MNETEFHKLADNMLEHMSNALEQADEQGALDVEYQVGIVTIELPDGKQFIVSKHAPSRQIWLSSPMSGGLHFGYNQADSNQGWCLPDGRALSGVLSQELQSLSGIEVNF